MHVNVPNVAPLLPFNEVLPVKLIPANVKLAILNVIVPDTDVNVQVDITGVPDENNNVPVFHLNVVGNVTFPRQNAIRTEVAHWDVSISGRTQSNL